MREKNKENLDTEGSLKKYPMLQPTLTGVAISKGKNRDRNEVQRAEETSTRVSKCSDPRVVLGLSGLKSLKIN